MEIVCEAEVQVDSSQCLSCDYMCIECEQVG